MLDVLINGIAIAGFFGLIMFKYILIAHLATPEEEILQKVIAGAKKKLVATIKILGFIILIAIDLIKKPFVEIKKIYAEAKKDYEEYKKTRNRL